MKHITWVSLTATLVLLVPLGASANPTGPAYQIAVDLKSVTGGPPPKVVFGKQVPVMLIYRNTGSKTLSRMKASFSPAEIIVKSRLPYTKKAGFYAPHLTANWLFTDVKPGATENTVVWLRFPQKVASAPGYTVAVEARGLGVNVFVSRLIILHYRSRANE